MAAILGPLSASEIMISKTSAPSATMIHAAPPQAKGYEESQRAYDV
jgi:hypothetical protein